MRELLGAAGPLAAALPGFRPRREQVRMAEAVTAAIAARQRLVVEAGTGTGKTFAYLVPALLSGRHVIVSTGTRTLQDQLYHRDLPLVSQALGRPVRVALLKGRANYLCRQRLKVAIDSAGLPGFETVSQKTLRQIAAWSQGTRSGDIAECVRVAESDAAWISATSTRDNCLGADCPEFSACHVVNARREAQAADLVIVNHHLLLADMALREEGFADLLPGTDAVILDEAHQLPEIAAQFFGLSFSTRQGIALARDCVAEFTRTGLYQSGMRTDIEALEQELGTLHRQLDARGERLEWHQVPEGFIAGLEELELKLLAIHTRVTEAGVEEAGPRQCAKRAEELAQRLRAILDTDPALGVRWLEWATRSFTLHFTPFEVADRLRAQMDSRPCAWIFTSATLAVGDDFAHFVTRVGAEEATTLKIDSPFDFEQQALLYLPPRLPDPAQPGYTAAVIDSALPLIRAAGGRAFVLFTSHRALSAGARVLRERLIPADLFPVLVQGEATRDVLLRQFRELGNAVLLATGSFWEGVDVRGPALSIVVIDKLPFASPEDPVLKARLEGLRRQGRNPFFDYQLPQAVLALKQGVGRLIRDPEDFGVVVLCDPRLRSKGYGRTFLSSLPPMRGTQDAAEAADFLRRRLAAVIDDTIVAPA